MFPVADVEAVLLDVGGVFHLPDHARVLGALSLLDVVADPADLDRAHFAGIAALGDRSPVGHHGDGTSIWHAYNRAYARVCGVPDDRLDEATEVLLAEFARGGVWTRQIPGARDALRAIADRGMRVGIVSNADGTVEAQLRSDGICQIGPGAGVEVHVVLDSGVVGVSKPDPEIFHLALEALQVAPESAIHVGDTPAADVAGALAAGVRPVLVDPYDFHPGTECTRVVALDGVVELLAERADPL
jgi:putative hydrolase of the HAD superfamily